MILEKSSKMSNTQLFPLFMWNTVCEMMPFHQGICTFGASFHHPLGKAMYQYHRAMLACDTTASYTLLIGSKMSTAIILASKIARQYRYVAFPIDGR